MTVHLVGWSGTPELRGGRDCRAYVDGVRVTVRRNTTVVRWLCAEHGESINNPNLCGHTAALAEAPALPEKRNRQ